MNKHNQLPVSLTIRKIGLHSITEVIVCPKCKHKNFIEPNMDFTPPYHHISLCWFCRRVSFDVKFVREMDGTE